MQHIFNSFFSLSRNCTIFLLHHYYYPYPWKEGKWLLNMYRISLCCELCVYGLWKKFFIVQFIMRARYDTRCRFKKKNLFYIVICRLLSRAKVNYLAMHKRMREGICEVTIAMRTKKVYKLRWVRTSVLFIFIELIS